MYPKRKSKKKKDIKLKDKLKDKLESVKSDYFLLKICDYLKRNKSLKIFKYSKKNQKRLNLNISSYKEYSEIFSSIEIELKTIKNESNVLWKLLSKNENKEPNAIKFINIKEEEKKYFHIYLNENKEETIKNVFNEGDKISRIKVIIDYQVESFENLFKDCECIEAIKFTKFYRNNITNMSGMFEMCSLLNELNLSKFNTENVEDMSALFYFCSSLKKLNLNNFKTNNVRNMDSMFLGCRSLKVLDFSNFSTKNVFNMSSMFNQCSSLKELDLSNFNTENVRTMSYMFNKCSSLIKINLSSF